MKTEERRNAETWPRCSQCRWVHEADSTAGTSFMGVELCPLHAVAPDTLAALRALRAESQGFEGFSTRTRALAFAVIARHEGGRDALSESVVAKIDADTQAYLVKHRTGGR